MNLASTKLTSMLKSEPMPEAYPLSGVDANKVNLRFSWVHVLVALRSLSTLRLLTLHILLHRPLRFGGWLHEILNIPEARERSREEKVDDLMNCHFVMRLNW
jgi:hypothetical protein